MTTHNGKKVFIRGGSGAGRGDDPNGVTPKRWVVERMSEDYKDEETGRSAWGVTDTHTEGYGHDTFDSQDKALKYAFEMNNLHNNNR